MEQATNQGLTIMALFRAVEHHLVTLVSNGKITLPFALEGKSSPERSRSCGSQSQPCPTQA
eukprot:6262634-Amphidinium_carterae.1